MVYEAAWHWPFGSSVLRFGSLSPNSVFFYLKLQIWLSADELIIKL
jgi:hypothetical protein